MFHKVIVMEIKTDYIIALKQDGEMVRIKYKDGLNVGDKIFILEEDIIHQTNDYKLFNGIYTKKIATILCILILCLFAYQIRPIKPVKAYAMLSVDGNGSLELRVDKEGNIQSASSLDNSYNEDELKNMKGKNIKELNFDGTKVVGMASLDDILDDEFKNDILAIFGDDVYYVKGDKTDIEKASNNNTSLVSHLLNEAISDDKLEEVLEDKPLEELYQIAKDNPELLNNEEVLEILEDKVEEEKNIKEDLEDQNNEDLEEDSDIEEDNEESNETQGI